MNSYLIEYNNKIMGVYNDLDNATLFINSCLQNNLMLKSANILVYKLNSCYLIDTITIKNNQELVKKQPIKPIIKQIVKQVIQPVVKPVINLEFVKKQEEMAKQKQELTTQLNLLKIKKERIAELKQIYENDIKLFELFNKNLKQDIKFIIPELFQNKYNLINKLINENRLSCDNFIKEYKHENNYNDYFSLNSYDESFIKLDDEEIEILSETNTSTGNNSDVEI